MTELDTDEDVPLILDPANAIVSVGLEKYRRSVSILKKGYEQERYRVLQISRSFLGRMKVKDVTSVDIATYRDERLATINKRTGKPLSSYTVRARKSVVKGKS